MPTDVRGLQVSALLDSLYWNAKGLNLFDVLTARRVSLWFLFPGRADGAENAPSSQALPSVRTERGSFARDLRPSSLVTAMPISIIEAVAAVGGASIASFLLYRFVKSRWTPVAILVTFWTTGVIVGPITNRTFIQLADLLDTSELHHDQIVALLGVLGIVGAVWAELRRRRATRLKGTVT